MERNGNRLNTRLVSENASKNHENMTGGSKNVNKQAIRLFLRIWLKDHLKVENKFGILFETHHSSLSRKVSLSFSKPLHTHSCFISIPSLQCSCSSWPTGYGKKLSWGQAQLGQTTCLAVAQFLSISCGPSRPSALYRLMLYPRIKFCNFLLQSGKQVLTFFYSLRCSSRHQVYHHLLLLIISREQGQRI